MEFVTGAFSFESPSSILVCHEVKLILEQKADTIIDPIPIFLQGITYLCVLESQDSYLVTLGQCSDVQFTGWYSSQ